MSKALIPEQKKLRTASRGVITKGSPKRLKEVWTSKGAGARFPNSLSSCQRRGAPVRLAGHRRIRSPGRRKSLTNSRPSGRTHPRVDMKRASGEQSKYRAQSSSGTEMAKGRKGSRCLTKWFKFSLTYGIQGEARRLRWPRARAPNSAAPWYQARIPPFSRILAASRALASSVSCQ